MINPAYKQLKQTKQRLRVMPVLQLGASELEQQTSSFQESVAEKLKTMSAQEEAELFYENVNTSYAETQW